MSCLEGNLSHWPHVTCFYGIKNLHLSMNKYTLQDQIYLFQHPAPDLLLEYSASTIAVDLWWTNQEFSVANIISPCSCITRGMNNMLVGDHLSQTSSTWLSRSTVKCLWMTLHQCRIAKPCYNIMRKNGIEQRKALK
jgi:hypothetical protein